MSLRLLYVEPTLTVFVHDGKPWTSAACADRPRCSRTRESPQLLVQLVPGAGERALFDAVKAAFEAKGPQGDRLVFKGAPASKPREVSEVFFTKSNEAAAQRLATELEPVIGSVAVKPWPGDWDYGVVIVVGAKKAP